MIAILSATEHDFYAMPLPLVVWSWKMIGVDCKVFIPADYGPKLSLAMTYCEPETDFYPFTCDKEKEATYAQVSRLFGWMTPGVDAPTFLITGDADLAVFNHEYFKQIDRKKINVIGADLLEESMQQYPMCFIAMPANDWATVTLNYSEKNSYQGFLDDLVGSIECENFRGNQWSLDQHLAYKWLQGHDIVHHPRAALPNRWASRRADRDGWYFDPAEIIDAHLPRPLTDADNFSKTIDLFHAIYPQADLEWMWEYREKYLSL